MSYGNSSVGSTEDETQDSELSGSSSFLPSGPTSEEDLANNKRASSKISKKSSGSDESDEKTATSINESAEENSTQTHPIKSDLEMDLPIVKEMPLSQVPGPQGAVQNGQDGEQTKEQTIPRITSKQKPTTTQTDERFLFITMCVIKIVLSLIYLILHIMMRTGEWKRMIDWARAHPEEWQGGADETLSGFGFEATWIVVLMESLLFTFVQCLAIRTILKPPSRINKFYIALVLVFDISFLFIFLIICVTTMVTRYDVLAQIKELDNGRTSSFQGISVLLIAMGMVYFQALNQIAIINDGNIDEVENEKLFATLHQSFQCCGLFDYRDWWYADSITLEIEKVSFFRLQFGPTKKYMPVLTVTSHCLLGKGINLSNLSLIHIEKDMEQAKLCFTPPSCCITYPKLGKPQCYDANKDAGVIAKKYSKNKHQKSSKIQQTVAEERLISLGFADSVHEIHTDPELKRKVDAIEAVNDAIFNPHQFTDLVKRFLRDEEYIEAMFRSELHQHGCIDKMLFHAYGLLKIPLYLTVILSMFLVISLVSDCVVLFNH